MRLLHVLLLFTFLVVASGFVLGTGGGGFSSSSEEYCPARAVYTLYRNSIYGCTCLVHESNFLSLTTVRRRTGLVIIIVIVMQVRPAGFDRRRARS
ncbi:uncharacterized protein CELE_F49F1.17 [Caenorhabditis elegans]|uniref:Secreted protein n=1 Tax=Caenorhabditis elegans TaxID=6239 RepID=U4PBT7_CAEEL|nr:Secreted protein [Caenorhabditis elegans]CDH93193.1 Secreted protein [Caenorhabditis elegans]|eukprot:NP_001294424.1 Uncharacterized protein CELE_F49F1.17 [Caenorhabditis elegans]